MISLEGNFWSLLLHIWAVFQIAFKMRLFFFNIDLNTLTSDSKHLLDLWTVGIRTGIAGSVLRVVRNLIFIVTIVQRCCHASSVRTELHVMQNMY